jgi:hypothetical protein
MLFQVQRFYLQDFCIVCYFRMTAAMKTSSFLLFSNGFRLFAMQSALRTKLLMVKNCG